MGAAILIYDTTPGPEGSGGSGGGRYSIDKRSSKWMALL